MYFVKYTCSGLYKSFSQSEREKALFGSTNLKGNTDPSACMYRPTCGEGSQVDIAMVCVKYSKTHFKMHPGVKKKL